MRRDVLAVMKGDGQEAKPKTEQNLKRHKETNDFNRKIRAQRLNRQMGVKNEERSAEKIVDKALNSSFSSSKIIRNDLRSQNDNVGSRLQERIRQRSAEPVQFRRRRANTADYGTPTASRRFFDECDRSGGGFEADAIDFESEFEKLMETFVEKKLVLVNEIKNRYLPQITELETQKSEVVELVVENLRQQMNDEIAACVMQLEEDKKQSIIDLKAKASKASS